MKKDEAFVYNDGESIVIKMNIDELIKILEQAKDKVYGKNPLDNIKEEMKFEEKFPSLKNKRYENKKGDMWHLSQSESADFGDGCEWINKKDIEENCIDKQRLREIIQLLENNIGVMFCKNKDYGDGVEKGKELMIMELKMILKKELNLE